LADYTFSPLVLLSGWLVGHTEGGLFERRMPRNMAMNTLEGKPIQALPALKGYMAGLHLRSTPMSSRQSGQIAVIGIVGDRGFEPGQKTGTIYAGLALSGEFRLN